MCSNVSVVCPAVVYASMLSELIGCPDLQEGFLLGSLTDHTRTQISDADMSTQTSHTTIHISSYLCMNTLGALYDGCGRVRDSALRYVAEFCATNKLSVVGWYRWRSCVDPWDRVFWRERLVHQQLQEKFGLEGFLLLLFNWRREGADCLPSTSHLLHYRHNEEFVRLPLQLSNLGNTSSSDYKLDPSNPALYTSSVLSPVLRQRLQQLEPGVQEATELHAAMEQTLQQQLTQLCEVQQLHRTKVQQLHKLRTICYLNHIVPDIEWPCAVGLEKTDGPKVSAEADRSPEISTKPPNEENSPSTEAPAVAAARAAAAATQPTETSNPATRRTPVKKRPPVPKQASPESRANGGVGEDKSSIDGLQRDLDKLDVRNGCEKKIVASSKTTPSRSLSRSSRGSPSKSRSPSLRGAAEQRTGTRSSPAPKSTPGSASKVKKRLNSNSGSDSPTRGGSEPTKQAWRL